MAKERAAVVDVDVDDVVFCWGETNIPKAFKVDALDDTCPSIEYISISIKLTTQFQNECILKLLWWAATIVMIYNDFLQSHPRVHEVAPY